MFTTPVNRPNLRYDLAKAQLIEPFVSAVRQKANIMLARFKVNNIVYFLQAVDIIAQHVKQQELLSNQPCHSPKINIICL